MGIDYNNYISRSRRRKGQWFTFFIKEFILQTAVTLVPFENVLAESSYFF